MTTTASMPVPTGPAHSVHDHLLPLIRTYFSLNLRADQKRALIHQQLQHNRFRNIVHGPPYERLEHWSRCLEAAKLEFEGLEQEWREREDGLAEDFEERVRRGSDELESLLMEVRSFE